MLSLQGEGNIWLTVLSTHSVFVQSRLLDAQTSHDPDADEPRGHKFVQHSTVKIFDLKAFYAELCALNGKRLTGQKLIQLAAEDREREMMTLGLNSEQVDEVFLFGFRKHN